MDNVLTVKGERKAEPDTTDKDYFVREIAYGGFQRSFALPEGPMSTWTGPGLLSPPCGDIERIRLNAPKEESFHGERTQVRRSRTRLQLRGSRRA
jgi:Hsp20/alpha crystallin family